MFFVMTKDQCIFQVVKIKQHEHVIRAHKYYNSNIVSRQG